MQGILRPFARVVQNVGTDALECRIRSDDVVVEATLPQCLVEPGPPVPFHPKSVVMRGSRPDPSNDVAERWSRSLQRRVRPEKEQAVRVVRHHDNRVDDHRRICGWDGVPPGLDHQASSRVPHLAIADLPEAVRTSSRTDSDEIRARLRIVVTAQSQPGGDRWTLAQGTSTPINEPLGTGPSATNHPVIPRGTGRPCPG